MRLFLAILLSAGYVTAGRFTCYLATWAVYRTGDGSFTIEDFPGDICTHGIYSFAGMNDANQVVPLDPGLDVDKNGYGRFVGLKQQFPNLKTALSVGGWSEGSDKYSRMAASPDSRAVFVQSVVDTLNQYGFDGFDFDWEYPGVDYRGGRPEDKANFVSILRELRAAFDAQGKGWELTIAVGVTQSVIDAGYDITPICQSVHFVNAMTYDFHGAWETTVDVHSPLNRRPQDTGANERLNVNDAMENWVNGGCPASQLVVGIPFYGKSFNIGDGNTNYDEGTASVGEGDAGPITQAPGTLAYYEICSNLNNGWTDKWDDAGMVPYAYQGHNWVGYENVRSVQAKADFVKSKGYAGAMTWSIDTDDFKGTCGDKFPLANAAKAAV